MTPQEMIDVIQAFKDGKQIESKTKHNTSIEWLLVTNPIWNFQSREYRIKPEQTKELYQFLLYNPTFKEYVLTYTFYPDLETAEQTYKKSKINVVKRLDHTKVTIEE